MKNSMAHDNLAEIRIHQVKNHKCQFLTHSSEPVSANLVDQEEVWSKARWVRHYCISNAVANSIRCLKPDATFIERFVDDDVNSLLLKKPSNWLRTRTNSVTNEVELSLKIMNENQADKLFLYEEQDKKKIEEYLELSTSLDCLQPFAQFHTNRYFLTTTKKSWIDECTFVDSKGSKKSYLVGTVEYEANEVFDRQVFDFAHLDERVALSKVVVFLQYQQKISLLKNLNLSNVVPELKDIRKAGGIVAYFLLLFLVHIPCSHSRFKILSNW